MKLLFTIIFCLYALCGFSQMRHIDGIGDNGVYTFQKATLRISNSESKGEIEHVNIDMERLEPSELFFPNVFKEATIFNKTLVACVLADNRDYLVQNTVSLSLAKIPVFEDTEKVYTPTEILPYTLSIENGVITFITRYYYGDSRYDFTLEGVLTVILTKQK